eukprot:scaffold11820_cov23-Tisochrysis_lutea.AAC.1
MPGALSDAAAIYFPAPRFFAPPCHQHAFSCASFTPLCHHHPCPATVLMCASFRLHVVARLQGVRDALASDALATPSPPRPSLNAAPTRATPPSTTFPHPSQVSPALQPPPLQPSSHAAAAGASAQGGGPGVASLIGDLADEPRS